MILFMLQFILQTPISVILQREVFESTKCCIFRGNNRNKERDYETDL
jgi:hypothetical protein